MATLDYTQDALYSYYDTKISRFLKLNKREEAQRAAFEWLHEYANSLCISVPWNWKIAKKQIAAHFFGKQHSIQLQFDDDINRGIQFIVLHSDQNVRCSYHRFNTACHSDSRRIDLSTLSWLYEIKESMSERDLIDIFVESSTETTTCFRRFSLQYNDAISYEMGYGQAMYVFEAEQGKHDTAGLNYSNGEWKLKAAHDPILMKHLQQLIKKHEEYLSIKVQCICYYLGIPQISIEGYFDTNSPSTSPMVVDIDLPFDRAFF